MASTSSSTKWQVFLSFRGADTRNNLKSHLEAALREKSINVYTDNINLRKGDEISQALKEAIKGSRIALIILSKDYASSPWCLNELLWILECRKNNNQTVIPIFYHVLPSDVRYQEASFKDAFDKHLNSERRRSDDEVKKWRTALKQVADLSGHHFSNQRSEREIIEEIVKDISKQLIFGCSNGFQDLVGIQSRIEQVTSLFYSESKEVVKVGIWGMGGIGKTTTARAVFGLISAQFESCHFIHNVRENFGNHDGHISLQNKLVSLILGEQCQEISSVIQDRLQSKKVLIVLDDVNDSLQLDFIRPKRCFGDGSRIIITSRDRQVLQQVVDEIYEVPGLIKGEDHELFNLFAFKDRKPKDDFVALSHRLVKCAKGVPLALKVLGSALKGKSSREWRSFLDKLKETPNPTIQKILRISYDDLDDDKQKTIFLDIACFFRNSYVKRFTKALVSELYGASSEYDIGVLIDKSLIVVSDSYLDMHDLLQEMGWDIVRQKSVEEPGKRSRLWKHKDVLDVLMNNEGTEAVQGMALNEYVTRELHISPIAFERMKNLRLLNFSFVPKSYVTGNELSSLPRKLKYLCWNYYPLKSLPLTFCAENLVHLIMSFSKLEKLWDGEQNLANLKLIDLSYSKNLLEIPNLSQARNLKSMDLCGCTSLCELPSCTDLTSLETLNVEGCSKITKFPEIFESIRELNLGRTGIQQVPASIGGFTRLEYLNLSENYFKNIPESIKQLSALEKLDLNFCRNLQSIPELPIGLKYLIADYCFSLETVSTPLTKSACVRAMRFLNCKKLDTSPLENEAQNMIMRRADRDVKLCTKGCINNPPLFIMYDGSQIPNGFIVNSTESDEISIKLPHCLVNHNNCLCIAFVIIIGLHNVLYHTKFNLRVKCGLKSENGVSHQFELLLVQSDFYNSLQDNQVVMGYSCGWHCELFKFGQSHSQIEEASFLLSSTYTDVFFEDRDIKIKKCGVCLLYNKDAEEEESECNENDPQPSQKRIKHDPFGI